METDAQFRAKVEICKKKFQHCKDSDDICILAEAIKNSVNMFTEIDIEQVKKYNELLNAEGIYYKL